MVGGLIVSAVVVILTTILLVKLFSRSGSRDSSNIGDLPIPNTSSVITTASSPSASGCWKYDVFLSFRGEDTRKTFVDHLYHALDQRAIRTYKDDVTLARGDTIGPSLLKAIQESQIALIVFSENYGDSSWCLDELSYIMKCKEDRGQILMPIFYHVDPSDVRKQKGEFGKAFAKHELSKNKVESWKKALFDASNIAGWEPKHVANGHEANCIKEIADSILDKLTSLDSTVEDDDLVGMGTRLKQLKSQLRIGSGGVRMVGIWGIGGGGKTTLATSLYLQISPNFDGCCFLGNIREKSNQQNGLQSLQEKILLAVFNKKTEVQSVELGKHAIKRMLSRRNVLIVLDDVDHLDQLKALAGCHNWFGDGSRIIITTRDQHLLTTHKVDVVSPISLLSHEDAIRLFNKHAYNEDNPLQDYEMLSQQIVSYAEGLPLALIVLGCFLYDKDNDEWIGTLARLKDHPEMEIMEKLKISYDGLKPVEQELFLDIACFFRWKSKDGAMEILDACGFYPVVGVKVLIQKALITVSSDGYFDMHDLVQEMAHYIVRGEHPYNPEKHSRVWQNEDIEDMCSRNATMENDQIEAIDMYSRNETRVNNILKLLAYDRVCSSSFILFVSNMKKIRFLRVCTGSNYDEGPSFLSNELRYIEWNGYPVSLFPESFQPTKLAALKMEKSLQKELWKGCKYLPCLKELKLDTCALVRTPDIGGLPCLQKLILSKCVSLEEIHHSLGDHNSLVHVHIEYCAKLARFPTIVRMEKLEILKISYCYALTEFPKIEAKMNKLVELKLKGIGIEALPSSVGEYCTNLISLKLERCSNLKNIEGNFHALKCLEKFHVHIYKLGSSVGIGTLSNLSRSLKKLSLSCCGLKDGEIPTEIGELSNLQELRLQGNDFTRIDFSLSRLTRLKLLNLSGCSELVELPELPSSLAILGAFECESLEEVIRDEIHTNCKWLSQVSITGGWRKKKKNIIGGERLLKTMLQGNAVESGGMRLRIQGLEIARGFEPRLVKGTGCILQQLPENWFNDFSGFLICLVYDYLPEEVYISMKHEHENGDLMDSEHDDLYWEEETDEKVEGNLYKYFYGAARHTWVGYIPFNLVRRHTSWWDDPTSTAIRMEIKSGEGDIISDIIAGCGFTLLPNKSETTTTDTSSSSSGYSDNYKCQFNIRHGSRRADLDCFYFTVSE